MTYSGYIIVFDEPRRNEWLLERQDTRGEARDWRFTDTLSAPDWRPKSAEVCFLSFGGKSLDFATLAERGNRVASAKYLVTFAHLLDLGAIPLADVEARISLRLARHLIRSSSGYGSRVPEKTWAACTLRQC